MYVKASSKRTVLINSSVSSNSSSVSPGNATMMSVDRAMSGMASRTMSTFSSRLATVYRLSIRFRIRSLPDCAGRCR